MFLFFDKDDDDDDDVEILIIFEIEDRHKGQDFFSNFLEHVKQQ